MPRSVHCNPDTLVTPALRAWDPIYPTTDTGGTEEATLTDWLSFAAAPTFSMMALLTCVLDGDMICSAAPEASPLTGMATMYLLMSAFHAAPWLRLIFGRRHPGED
jgi:hypothetical protein